MCIYYVYVFIFIYFHRIEKIGIEKMNKTSLFTEDMTLVDEDEFLSVLQGTILITSPIDLLTDVPSTPTPEIRNKGNLNIEKLN